MFSRLGKDYNDRSKINKILLLFYSIFMVLLPVMWVVSFPVPSFLLNNDNFFLANLFSEKLVWRYANSRNNIDLFELKFFLFIFLFLYTFYFFIRLFPRDNRAVIKNIFLPAGLNLLSIVFLSGYARLERTLWLHGQTMYVAIVLAWGTIIIPKIINKEFYKQWFSGAWRLTGPLGYLFLCIIIFYLFFQALWFAGLGMIVVAHNESMILSLLNSLDFLVFSVWLAISHYRFLRGENDEWRKLKYATRYVLHGGRTSSGDPEKWKHFVKEIITGRPVTARVLLVFYAKPKELWDDKFKQTVSAFREAVPDCELKFKIASEDVNEFIKQAKRAQIIFFAGGRTELIKEKLGAIRNLREIFSGKVIAGSSAGANFLAKYYFSDSIKKILPGLGLLPIKVFCHYFDDKQSLLNELKQHAEQLDTYALNEGECVTIFE